MQKTNTDFVFSDGGRAASGFVGLTGDCVTRAIAIATGQSYRSVYDEIGERTAKSPRGGVETSAAEKFLKDLGWQSQSGMQLEFAPQLLPKGIVIVDLVGTRKNRHYTCMVDRTIYDTWNPAEDSCYKVVQYFLPPEGLQSGDGGIATGAKTVHSQKDALTQKQFEKILRRLRALDNTASNEASTEGEKRNAIRMMQSLMLTHNLSQEDLSGESEVSYQFTRRACPLNGRKAASWEKDLAWYVCDEVFPNVRWFMSTRGHRTLFWFYGPHLEVENAIELFRELVVTIAAAAKIKYRSWVRGSGASYAEGYVAGLPKFSDQPSAPKSQSGSSTGSPDPSDSNNFLRVQRRALAVHDEARRWLAEECDVRLGQAKRAGRYAHDDGAAKTGRIDGAKHKIQPSTRQGRLTNRTGG